MDLWRKLLILAIIVLFSYILWRLLLKRREILLAQSQYNREHFTPITNPVSISNINVNALTTKNGITNPMNAKKLKQFVIKASYHTCYTGSDLSASMVTYALNRGYRWLDFCTSDGKNVCYSTDDTLTGITSLSPTVEFGNIATQIAMNGFTSPGSPNPGDPLFIQIRPLYSSDNTNTNIMQNLITMIGELSTTYNLPVYTGKIDKNTTIDQLMKKVIIVMDTNNNNMTNDSDKNKYSNSINLNNLVNLNSNDNTVMTTIPIADTEKLKAPMPLILADNFTTTPPDKIYQIFPTGATANSDVY